MRIAIATPAPAGSRAGNRVSALRWAGMLRARGHHVRVTGEWDGGDDDLLVALHARRSATSADRWRAARGAAPLVVVLTGTDLYEDLPAGSAGVRRSLDRADRIVVLHPLALTALPASVRGKARAIVQSATPPRGSRPAPAAEAFEVVALAHLRRVKDPLLLADAVRLLPARSRVRAVHLGAALDPALAARARAESDANRRWRWGGDVPHEEAKRRLAAARLLVVTSTAEGAANAVSEALACGTPVLSTSVDGSVGVLGAGYRGLYASGDSTALAALLLRAEEDPPFLTELRAACAALAPLVDPARERDAWCGLVEELAGA